MITLRSYQADLLDRARAEMQRGARRVLVQAPTGAGKTALTAQMLARAVERGKRAWFLVHRVELLRQSVSAFATAADLQVGVIAAGFPATPDAPVQVCSVGTLTRRLRALTPPDFVVFDECHHVASASWSAIAQTLPLAHHVGLSATPQRLDGRGLGPYFDALVVGPSTADLIAQGWLSPYRLFAPGRPPTLTGVHRVAGDYNKRELSTAMTESTVVGDAVSHYQQHCPDARALIFAWSLDASRQIAQQFRDVGVDARHVDGDTSSYEREDTMRRFRAGDTRVLCNVDLFGEGLDVPAVDALFLLRPTQSLGLYLQQVGRGLRPADGKPHVTIFDHVTNWERHGLPDDDRTWSLDGATKKAAETVMACKRCPVCFAVVRLAVKVCSSCATPFVVQSREVARVEGALVEFDAQLRASLRARREELQRDCHTPRDWFALAKQLGYKPGWAWLQWQAHARRAGWPQKTI